MQAPETLLEAVTYFSNPENAFEFFKQIRWPKGVRCPRCNSDKVTFLENAMVWKCRTPHPKQKFSAKVGTIFEDSPIGLEKWLPAMWMAVNCKNGISSYELHRALGVTQKTAWFMLQRIRLAMQKGGGLFKGEVEVDETFIGGRARKMNAKQRARRKTQGSGQWNLEPVQGILERTTEGQPSQVCLFHVTRANRKQLDPNVRKNVEKGAEIFTDALKSYNELSDEYQHKVIDHAECYAKGRVHTNGLENFWSLLKRGLGGTYVSVEPFHLFRYLDEQVFRYNNRATKDNPLNDADRFHLAMTQITGKRLTLAEVTGKVEETSF